MFTSLLNTFIFIVPNASIRMMQIYFRSELKRPLPPRLDEFFWNDLIKISAYVPSLGSGTVDIAVSFTNGNNESFWPGRIFYNIQPQTIIMPGPAGNQIPIIDLDTPYIFIQNKFPYRVTIYAKNGIKVTSNYIENLFLIRPGMYYTNNYFLFDPTRIKITSGSSYEYFRFIGNQIYPDSPLNAESFNLQFNDIDYGTAIEDRKFSIYLLNATNSLPMHPSSYYLHSSSKEYFSEKYNTGSYGRIDMQLRLLQDISGMHKVGNLYTLAIVYNENGLCYTNVLPMADWFAVYDKVMLDILEEYCDNYDITTWMPRTGSTKVERAVAYSFGCKDMVADFNADMRDAEIYLLINGITNQTSWNQYTNISYRPRRDEDIEHVAWVAEGYTFSSHNHPKYYAGIDCSGFVQRGARHHTILSLSNKLLPETRVTHGCTSEFWTDYDARSIGAAGFLTSNYTVPVQINHMVPGDILVSSTHVVVVWKIDTKSAPRGTWHLPAYYQYIRVIEANPSAHKVSYERTYDNVNIRDLTLRRLKE